MEIIKENGIKIRTLQQDQPGHPGAHINRDWLLDNWRTRSTGRLARSMDNPSPRGFSLDLRKEAQHGGAETWVDRQLC